MAGGQPESRREELLTALLGAVADAPVCVYDRELRMVEYFWGGEERRYGYSPSEILGKRFSEVMSAEDAAPVEEAVREVFATGQSRRLERSFSLPVGRVAFEVRFDPIHGPGGEVEQVLTTSYDVTERRHAQEELRESEHRFQSLAEAMPIGVWRTDRDRNVVYANRRNWELLDIDPEGADPLDLRAMLVQMAASGRIEMTESERLWSEAERAVREETIVPSFIRLRMADGSVRHLQTLALPERDSSGDFVGHVGVTIDVTELARIQQELARHRDHLGELVAERTLELERSYEALRRSERLAAVGTFAAGIAHQINNPVGAILLAGQFALEDPGDRERVESALRDITADARHCGRIVRSVLEFAQGPTEAPRPCDLNQIARDGVLELLADAAERGAALRLDLDPELPQVAGSEAALEQVLANLVYNAIEAGAAEIVIGTRQAPGGVALVVRDDGQGIPDENLDRIFDPLFTTRASLGGTGLGLALARGVVEALGGAIEVKSRPSEGTEIVVRLKRARLAARRRKPSPAPRGRRQGSKQS